MSKLPSPPFFVLRGHSGCVTALHFTDEIDNALTSQPTLISGSQTGEIFVWNLKTFRTRYKFEGHSKTSILYLNYYKSSLISHGRDGILNVWKFLNEQWTITRQFQSPNVGFCASIFYFANNEPHVVLFNDETHTVGIYNYENETKERTLKIKDVGMCMCMKAIHLKEKAFLLIGYESGQIGLWDCESDNEVSQLKLHNEPIMCLDYDTQHKKKGISGSVEKVIKTWTIQEDFTLIKVQEVMLNNDGIIAVKIREDGKILITGGSDSNIRIFSWKSLKLLAILDFHEFSIYCLSCCSFPVGKQTSIFASGSKDKRIALWSIY
ncbi:Guanine nucleotide-binding protein subunit like protein [Argiope bruennichi]|uniref:Guanine nucleotide-binding protein subunit like protein n=1 Tax=Argiope bruennichi TaxID=94029 RepID=A0A8T0ELC3_ARGBR|nr:Guanine nucleotide-binding protein subunit like protein [Argiope bruennichi]